MTDHPSASHIDPRYGRRTGAAFDFWAAEGRAGGRIVDDAAGLRVSVGNFRRFHARDPSDVRAQHARDRNE